MHSGFDDHRGAQRVDHFLQAQQVFRKLQYRQAEPAEIVIILEAPADTQPGERKRLKGFFGVQADRVFRYSVPLRQGFRGSVDHNLHPLKYRHGPR